MKRSKLLLLLILFLALFLRIALLDKAPLELFGDEVDAGYQAYSIFKTGRDYRGNFLPAYAESFAEPRAPFLFYSMVPFVALLGLNEWGVRLPSVFFGILSVLFLFFLVKEIICEEKLALTAAFLLAVSPWHITYSRTAFEVSLLLFLILAGTLSFLKATKGKIEWLLIAAIFFGLSFYTYNTANIFIPLWLFFLTLAYRQQLIKKWPVAKKKILLSALLILLIVIPLFKEILFGSAGFRFGLVSIFSDPKMIDTISFKRSIAPIGSVTERIFHNKFIWWSKSFFGNYLESFSFKFLFVSGDPNPRHSLPGFGLLFLSFSPIFLFGVYQLIDEKKKENFFLLAWLILAPIPASLTADGGNHATRLFLMLPALIIICAKGVILLLSKKSYGKIVLALLSLFFMSEISLYTHEFLVHYPKEHYRYWHYGYKEAIKLFEKNKNLCQKIYFNNSHEPFLIRYLFWTKTDPVWFRQNFKGDRDGFKIGEIFQGFSLGSAYFGRIISSDKMNGIRILLAGDEACYLAFQGDDIPGDWDLSQSALTGIEVLGEINDPNGNSFLYLLH